MKVAIRVSDRSGGGRVGKREGDLPGTSTSAVSRG